jgi:hypothetical protein
MSKFTILSKDDAASNSVKIAGDVVSLQHATVHPKIAPQSAGQRIQFEWHFDFTDVTREELMEIASRSLVITMRAPFKTLDNPTPEDWNGKRFGVRTWIDDEKRQPQDKVAKTRKLMESLTPEQKEQLLKDLGL